MNYLRFPSRSESSSNGEFKENDEYTFVDENDDAFYSDSEDDSVEEPTEELVPGIVLLSLLFSFDRIEKPYVIHRRDANTELRQDIIRKQKTKFSSESSDVMEVPAEKKSAYRLRSTKMSNSKDS
jgi:hypothetical protein